MPLNFIGTIWRMLRQNMVDVEQMFELIETKDIIPEVENPLPKKTNQGALEFKNVSFSYLKDENKSFRIFENLSFKIPPGKSLAIVGQTGAGKSTIMRLLYRFYDINSGEISIDGNNIAKLRKNDFRSDIAIVPQDCVLFNDTIEYNIAYGGVNNPELMSAWNDPNRKNEFKKMIIAAAIKAQLHEFIMTQKDLYNTKV